MSEPVVVGVDITAGHDGTAEMVVQVRHENGVVAPVVLDQDTSLELMRASGAASTDALIGRPWRELFRTTLKTTVSGDAS
jgi:hypothetical protein